MTTFDEVVSTVKRLEEQVASLALLTASGQGFGPYTVGEFAKRVDRSPYCVREWARHGRILATRRATGRGPYREWVISHEELLRYRREGLLPSR